jgi:hypothetical protein
VRERSGAALGFVSGQLSSRSFVMQSEIAPLEQEPPAPRVAELLELQKGMQAELAPISAALRQMSAALALCLDELESLQERVARLERG